MIKPNRKIRELENKPARVVIRYVPAPAAARSGPTADNSRPTADNSSASQEECRSGYRAGYQWDQPSSTLNNVVPRRTRPTPIGLSFSSGVTAAKSASTTSKSSELMNAPRSSSPSSPSPA